jgi:hypothetical protein
MKISILIKKLYILKIKKNNPAKKQEKKNERILIFTRMSWNLHFSHKPSQSFHDERNKAIFTARECGFFSHKKSWLVTHVRGKL